jgi:integrase
MICRFQSKLPPRPGRVFREERASESTVDRYMALLRAILRNARDEWRYIDNCLRMRSMLQLTWDRVDLEGRRAWVPPKQMKGGRSFGFPLSSAAVAVLKRCRKLHPAGNRMCARKVTR